MSIPRVLLAPTHRTGLANAIAAALTEIATAHGQSVRYHHVGPLSPACSWDRWEGAAFLDPALYGEETLLELYEAATHRATVSLLSSSAGLFDQQDGVSWLPGDVARLLDCPVVVVLDCRDWGTGLRVLLSGLQLEAADLNLAGIILSGVADREHFTSLRRICTSRNLAVVGCLFEGDGPGWKTPAPSAWELPLDPSLLDAVSRQVDIAGVVSIAGQRGFLSAQSWLTDRGAEGPVIAVAGGKGFTLWSRDSVEVLRAAGARVRRLDLLEDSELPEDLAGLVLAGTLWPGALADIAMNTALLRAVRARIARGLPTLALGGGMLVLLDRVQDFLGRTSDMAGVIPAQAEVLWDLEEPVYVKLNAARSNLLFTESETATGWVLTEAEISDPGPAWVSPFRIDGAGQEERGEGLLGESVLASRVLVHLAANREMARRFVSRCSSYAART
jgi:cobyrinic acid a,c-diamide synthase